MNSACRRKRAAYTCETCGHLATSHASSKPPPHRDGKRTTSNNSTPSADHGKYTHAHGDHWLRARRSSPSDRGNGRARARTTHTPTWFEGARESKRTDHTLPIPEMASIEQQTLVREAPAPGHARSLALPTPSPTPTPLLHRARTLVAS